MLAFGAGQLNRYMPRGNMIFVLERIIKETYIIDNEYGTADMALSYNLSDCEPDKRTVYPPIITHVHSKKTDDKERI